jgi:hypothetical protein
MLSKMMRRLLSMLSKRTRRFEATSSKCLHTHMVATGSAVFAPMMSLVAEEEGALVLK